MLCASDGKTWRLSQLDITKKINSFLYSRTFLVVLALLAVIGHVLEIEMCVYWIYTAIMVYVALFARDFLLLIPVTINCYIMPSYLNNPGKHAESIFFMENGAYQFAIMAGIILLTAVFRMIFDREIGFRNLTRVRMKLLWGMLALCAAYLLSGLGSANFAENFVKNTRFALLQCVAIIVLYFILSYSVKWEECDRRYLCYVLVLMGLVIGIEVLNVYLVNQVVVNGTIDKIRIYVGWGISNNIGLHIAMGIPAAFYFVYKNEKAILYNIVAILLCLFTALTLSRAAILGACALYGVCVLLVIWKGSARSTKKATLICGAASASGGMVVLLASGVLSHAFPEGLGSWSRMQLYRFGIDLFKKNPIMGGGFFSLNEWAKYYYIWEKVDAFSDGFPDRWHSTVIQILVSCGLVGMAAYLFHRYQTVKLFVKKCNVEKAFVGGSLLLLLLLSLIDCHFFNVGPVLIYSAALAFIEGTEAYSTRA